MAPFSREGPFELDWQLLVNTGPNSRYNDAAYLDEDIAWLRNRAYRIVEYDCASWANEAAMHHNFATSLDFPSWYGTNLSALSDCLYSLVIDRVGLVLVLRHFETLADTTRFRARLAWWLCDILAIASRRHAHLGERLMTLIHGAGEWDAPANLRSASMTLNGREWHARATKTTSSNA